MKGQPPNRALRALKILLVEDSDDIRDVFSGLLRSEGADVVAMGSGNAAIAAALRDDFDVVVTDYGLPDVPGDFLIRQVLATARHRPRVVVVTGYGEPYAGWAREAGADLVLTKPVEWPQLLHHLRPERLAA
jgi:two-component system CheB/CheR fusion protein